MTEKARILLVDDRPTNLSLLRDALEPEGYELLVATSGEAALSVAESRSPDLVLLDVVMPGIDGYETCRRLKALPATRDVPVIFLTARDDKASLLEGFAAGAVDYLTKPFAAEEVVVRVHTHLSINQLTRDLARQTQELSATNQRLRDEIERRQAAEEARRQTDEKLELIVTQESERWGIDGFIGQSATIRGILEETRLLQSVATSGVLILGESGTGKELIARAIHSGSQRAHRQFVPVNCSAIPRELAESIFFGHLKGSFTGAQSDRKGCFEAADGGTLFLDEIGDMPLDLQAKLLRVLDNGLVTPVGAAQPRRFDVRVLAATNSDLSSAVTDGRFRRDLYFRIAHTTVMIPPLRERREDIPLLARHFVDLYSREMGRAPEELDAAVMARLQSHDYSGNVRELRNMVEAALIRSGGGRVRPEHLTFPNVPATSATTLSVQAGKHTLAPEQVVRNHLSNHGTITNSQCRQLLNVNRHRASYLLDKLTASGVLARQGANRGAYYTLADTTT